MSILIKNIKGLIQVAEGETAFRRGIQMSEIPMLENAYLYTEGSIILDYGLMENLPKINPDQEIDASGRYVLPSYIDSHTHLVFPETREQEFVMKIRGATYEEIAANGGGILNSARKLRESSEDELLEKALIRLDEIIRLGTGAVEIKSGYGLTTESELKMLRVIKKLREISKIPVKATFLGAHAIPPEFKENKKAYIGMITNEMLPEIKKNQLADYIDIFIEKGFYDLNDAEEIIEAGIEAGLKPRLHTDQLTEMGGLPLALKYNAISADHLEQTSDQGIELLKTSSTIPTLLPSCSFFLNMEYPKARKMIDNGLGISIASDYNPGSSPSGNLNFSMSLACIKMKLLPEEALNAITINAAHALELSDTMGTIKKGNIANILITKPIKSWYYLPYSFGNNAIETIILNGEIY